MSTAPPPQEEPTTAPEPAPGDAPGTAREGLGAVLQDEEFSVRDAIGGPRGILESVLPTLLFVVLFVAIRSVLIAGVAATAAVAVFVVARLLQRQSVGTAMGGLVAAALGAVLAIRSGEGTDFYWPGIVTNAVSLLVLVLSLALRRPLLGVVVALLDPRVRDWAQDSASRRVYTRATLLFAGLYAAKLAVQLPLLLTGQVAALGAAKIAMGLPAFAVIAYLVWLMHRSLLARRGLR
ncbi:DUF3159 domain-containing protein [Brachybacterium saurashtrense]|uniref:DUF3159 domain-containing protein n=1 Tax=Brachybacterium saurashtrense TaxID=556288 RepID=A0A345YM35_9MICO|nr:DUF3159 domain-containing protein [Brachybacterium saurashtrense]AXK44987.1 DUF3159 domain-containing protein [Brachybacterium saurashtrense]RRR21671.1 DUF3159 domain-containing protein [Brachybacterium saurashtrense]